MRVRDPELPTYGNCSKPETIIGGVWDCYTWDLNKPSMCILKGPKCRGRIRCSNSTWSTKPGKPTPVCRNTTLLEFQPNDHISIISNTATALLFLIMGIIMKNCNLSSTRYSLSKAAERFRQVNVQTNNNDTSRSWDYYYSPVVKPRTKFPNLTEPTVLRPKTFPETCYDTVV